MRIWNAFVRSSLALTCCALFALPAAAADAGDEYVLSWTSLHMGTVISSKVYGRTAEDAKRYASLVEAEVERFDKMMSVHEATPLNEVNRRAGEKVEVTPEIAEMTLRAVEATKLSGGAFDPTIGPVVNVWKIGFGGDEVPSDDAIAAAVAKVDVSRVRVTEEKGRHYVQLDPGQFLDMGGIAKGYIGEKIAEELRAAGAPRALLDLGGNVVALNGKTAEAPWRVGLQRPDTDRGAYFAVVEATDESVITSGAYERYLEKDGKRYGHILDPKTGKPALTDISSVTIVNHDGAMADALCTAIFAMGWEKGTAFLKAHPEVHAVLLHADLKRAALSASLAKRVRFTDESIRTEVLGE